MQDMRVEEDGVSLIFGPHTDERAVESCVVRDGACRAADGICGLAFDAVVGNRGNEISPQGARGEAPGVIQQSHRSIRRTKSVRRACAAEALTAKWYLPACP